MIHNWWPCCKLRQIKPMSFKVTQLLDIGRPHASTQNMYQTKAWQKSKNCKSTKLQPETAEWEFAENMEFIDWMKTSEVSHDLKRDHNGH